MAKMPENLIKGNDLYKIAENPHAHALLCILHHLYGFEEFEMPRSTFQDLGWTKRQWLSARNYLLNNRWLRRTHFGGNGRKDIARYKLNFLRFDAHLWSLSPESEGGLSFEEDPVGHR